MGSGLPHKRVTDLVLPRMGNTNVGQLQSHGAEHSLEAVVPSPTLRCPSLLYVDFSNNEIGVSSVIPLTGHSRGTVAQIASCDQLRQ